MKRHDWSSTDLDLLKKLYPITRTERLARMLNLTVAKVYAKANVLGIKKSAEYLASEHSGRLRAGQGGATRFKPGHVTWNKGMKGLEIGGKETRFKKGHRGGRAVEVYKPIGSERISKDGYLQRKINDDMPLQKRWRGVHIIVWEEANGPLPAGHAVTFKDGNKKNITPNNLELVSRADLMKRNTYHNYGPEIAQLVQLKGAITRQINKREREST